MAKRFLVFAGSDYYPEGGLADIKGMFDSKDTAMAFVANTLPTLLNSCHDKLEWWHIYDTQTGEVVAKEGRVEVAREYHSD